MADINLVARKRKTLFSLEQMLTLFRVTAVISVVVVVSLSILFFLLSRDPSVIQIKTQQSQVLAQLTILQDKTAKYLIIFDRVNKIQSLQKKQGDFGQLLSKISGQIPENVGVSNILLDKQTFSLALSSTDLSLLGKAVDNFSQLVEQKKLLQALTIEGLVSDEKGQKYILTMTGKLL